MYDYLDSQGVQAVLEAIKGKFPESLPADGGTADGIKGNANVVRTTTSGLSFFHYETKDTATFEIPTGYVDIIRMMYTDANTTRGVEIAVNWHNTTRRMWVRGYHGGWSDWEVINRPYVVGSTSVAASATTVETNHGFTPSAVLYSGLGGVQFATSATTTSFDLADGSTSARTIKYIIFR